MSENRGLEDVFGSLDEDDKKRLRLNGCHPKLCVKENLLKEGAVC